MVSPELLALLTLPVANGFSRTSSLTHIAYGNRATNRKSRLVETYRPSDLIKTPAAYGRRCDPYSN
jgi:hypothetical protein